MKQQKKKNLILRNRDANAGFNRALTQKLVSVCEQCGVSFQFKDEYVAQMNARLAAAGEEPVSIGSTEMGRIIAASNGLVDGTTLQIPTSGYHTLEESAPMQSVDAFIRVLQELSEI